MGRKTGPSWLQSAIHWHLIKLILSELKLIICYFMLFLLIPLSVLGFFVCLFAFFRFCCCCFYNRSPTVLHFPPHPHLCLDRVADGKKLHKEGETRADANSLNWSSLWPPWSSTTSNFAQGDCGGESSPSQKKPWVRHKFAVIFCGHRITEQLLPHISMSPHHPLPTAFVAFSKFYNWWRSGWSYTLKAWV